MVRQASLSNERASILLHAEIDQPVLSRDSASQRNTRLLWTGFGFSVLMLIGVSASAVLPLAPHASAKTSLDASAVGFIGVAPLLRPGTARSQPLTRFVPLPMALGKPALHGIHGGSTYKLPLHKPTNILVASISTIRMRQNDASVRNGMYLGATGMTDGTQSSGLPDPERMRLIQQNALFRYSMSAESYSSGLNDKAARLLDMYFRHALDELSLDENDLSELDRRGVDRKDIAEGCFKTWSGGNMTVPFMESATSIGLKDIWAPPSMLIPARSHDGLITAIVSKPHPREDPEQKSRSKKSQHKHSPKYKYVSRDRSFFLHPDRIDKPQAWPETEEPLFVCEAGGVHKSVALVEGSLIPSVFASELKARQADLHSNVIGAGGGQFSQSPSLMFHALAGMQADTVVLYADAGSTLNKDVILAYLRTFQMLQEWQGMIGFDVRVAWWGQVSKDDLDVDDFLNQGGDLSQIEELSIQDFWSKVSQELRTQLLSSEQKAAVYRLVIANEQLHRSQQ